MAYDVAIMRDARQIEGLLPEWREFLATRARGHNFHNDPTIIGLSLGDSSPLSPRIVVLRRSGQIQGIAPFYIHPTRLKLEVSVLPLASFPARAMGVFGKGLIYAEDADRGQINSIVVESLDQFRGEFDLIILDETDVTGCFWKHCEVALPPRGGYRRVVLSPRHETNHRVPVRSSYEDYLKTIGPNTRQALRRNTRRLLGEHRARLTRVTMPGQVRGFLAQLDEVYRDSWQARLGSPGKNTEPQVAWFERIAEQGWLRSYLLLVGDTPISFQVGFVYDHVYYATDFAYAQAYSHLSPGSVLMNLFLEELFASGMVREIDLGPGDMPQKRSFRSTSSDIGTAYIVHTAYWHNVLKVQKCIGRLEGVARAALTRMHLDQAVRRVLKRKYYNARPKGRSVHLSK
jgi:CelD/BcsL family acetyltransferase involved in cellulose biosynthesis